MGRGNKWHSLQKMVQFCGRGLWNFIGWMAYTTMTMGDQRIYTVGGAVPSDRIYIARQADATLCELCRGGQFAYILTARQLGKSSLRRRIAQQLDSAGIVSIDIDLTAIGTPAEAAAWYLGVLTTIEDILLEKDLFLQTDVITFWHAHTHLGPTQRFTRFFHQVLLAELNAQIVIFVDEIDTTLKMDYTDDFFAAIRYFHEARTNYPEFQRLSFVLIGVATPTALINDPKRTPFNIGQRVHLTDFTYQEALPFAEGLSPSATHAQEVLQWLLAWTKGHPYLTQRLCNELAKQTKTTFCKDDVDQAVCTIFLAEGSHGDDNLKWVGDFLIRGAPEGQVEQVLSTYRTVYRGQQLVPDHAQSSVVTHLKLSGVVGVHDNHLCTRNPIYEAVFSEQWIKEQWPTSWWASIPPAIKLAGGVIALLFVALLFISAFALDQQRQMKDEMVLRSTAESRALANEQMALTREAEANAQVQLATSRQLAAVALTNLETEPELSAWLALRAIDTQYTVESENALRQAIQALRTEQAWPFSTPKTMIFALALSPDHQRLAVAGEEGVVKIWQRSATGATQLLHTIKADETWVGDLTFSPDGHFLATTGANVITLWDATTGKVVATLQGDATKMADASTHFTAVTFSADSIYVAALDLVGRLRIWDIVAGQLLATVQAHAFLGEGVAFSPLGHWLATAGQDEAVKLWDVTNINHPQPVATLNGHSWGVADVAFSPDGKTLATAGRDTVTLLWDLGDDITQPRQRQKLIGHSAEISEVVFSPNGNCLATASLDRKVRVWDLHSTLLPLVLAGHSAPVTGVLFAPSSQDHPESLLSPCGAQLITGSHDGMIRTWNIGASRELRTLTGHQDAVRAVAFSRDGRYLASASDDHTAMIWATDTGQRIHVLQGHRDRVTDVAFSPDNAYLVTTSLDKTIQFWEVQSGQVSQALPTQEAGIIHGAFSANGQWLATVDEEGRTKLWPAGLAPLHLRTPTLLHGCPTLVEGIAFSQDSKALAMTCLAGSVAVWDLATQRVTTFASDGFGLRAVAFSQDGNYLATVGAEEVITVWNHAGKKVIEHRGNQNRLHSIDFSPTGQWFVTSGDNRVAQLYDAATGEPRQTLPGNLLGVNDARFSPDNQLVATAGEDGTIRLYVVGLEPLRALARTRLIQRPVPAICVRYFPPAQCLTG